MSEIEDNYLEISFVDSGNISHKYKKKNNNNVTDNVITPSEYIKLLSYRSAQLSRGYEPLIKINGDEILDPFLIAKREIERRVLPLLIVRKIPDSTKPQGYREEIWELKNLDLRDF